MNKISLYVLLLFIMVIWGFNVIAIKVLVTHTSPLAVQSLRIFTAGFVAVIILFFLKELRRINKKQLPWIILASLMGVVGHHMFLAIGLMTTTASNAGLILGLIPLVTSTFAMLFLGDRLTKFKFLGILFGITGVSFIILNKGPGLASFTTGDIYVLLAVITQAISFVIIKRASASIDSRLLTVYMLFIGSTLLFILSLFVEPNGVASMASAPASIWLIFILSAIFATGIGHMSYNYAIPKLGAGETAIFINLTPFFALIGAYFFLDETITSMQILGFFFIVAGVIFGTGVVDKKWKKGREQQVA